MCGICGYVGQKLAASLPEALASLARRKGYELAACTHCNCIFVRREEFSKLGFAPLDITAVFPRKHLVYLMSCYNGKTFMSQPLLYSTTKRSVIAWRRNALWPDNALPVICQQATRKPR